ncbi:MAG: EFR1 family ferrodoxin [Bacilli bacterium]
MKKCLLYVFSGTGNTALASKFLAKHLSENGYEVTNYLFQAPNSEVPCAEGYDLVGFGYPIHAFNVPGAFAKFVNKLPKLSKRTKAFIFKVSGEPYHLNDSSSHHIVPKLKRRGYDLIMEKHLLMPYNIMFRYPDGVAKQMYLYLDALTNVLAKKLAAEEEDKLHYNIALNFFSVLLRIEWVAPKLNCLFVRIDKKKCTNCHLCMNKCPTQSMYLSKKGEIRIHSSCAMCMNCTYCCPKNAIKFGFMNNWKVNGPFNYEKIKNDESIKADYINRNTKDYFRHFKNYYYEQNLLLTKYQIPLPVNYPDNESLLNKKEDKKYAKQIKKESKASKF